MHATFDHDYVSKVSFFPCAWWCLFYFPARRRDSSHHSYCDRRGGIRGLWWSNSSPKSTNKTRSTKKQKKNVVHRRQTGGYARRLHVGWRNTYKHISNILYITSKMENRLLFVVQRHLSDSSAPLYCRSAPATFEDTQKSFAVQSTR